MKNVSFGIKPLDINITKMQFRLIQTLESDNVEFPITDEIEVKDPALNVSSVKLICDSLNKNDIGVDITIVDNYGNGYPFTFAKGKKHTIFQIINSKEFFIYCKEMVLKVDSGDF